MSHTKLSDVVINNKRLIKKVEDWKDLKIRTGPGKEWTISCFGASAIPLSSVETPTAVQTGMVDGAVLTAQTTVTAGWDSSRNTARPYTTRGALIPSYYPLASLAWWNGLNDATRAMIFKAWEGSQHWMHETWVPAADGEIWKQVQVLYGKNFYNMPKEDPAELERHRVLLANVQAERVKKSLSPEMYKLVETKYRW